MLILKLIDALTTVLICCLVGIGIAVAISVARNTKDEHLNKLQYTWDMCSPYCFKPYGDVPLGCMDETWVCHRARP